MPPHESTIGQRVLPPWVNVSKLIAQGFFFQGELADFWADGRLDWRSCLCRN